MKSKRESESENKIERISPPELPSSWQLSMIIVLLNEQRNAEVADGFNFRWRSQIKFLRYGAICWNFTSTTKFWAFEAMAAKLKIASSSLMSKVCWSRSFGGVLSTSFSEVLSLLSFCTSLTRISTSSSKFSVSPFELDNVKTCERER